MKKMLGAAVVVCALFSAGSSSASTIIDGGIIEAGDPPSVALFWGDEDGGVFRFRSSAKITQRWVEVDTLGRFYGHTLDGVYHLGSTTYLPVGFPVLTITERSDGFMISFDIPDDQVVYSDACFLESCGLEDISQFIASMFVAAAFESGAEGAAWSFERVTTSAVPEPETWAMMIGGFGLAGAAIRRRRSTPDSHLSPQQP